MRIVGWKNTINKAVELYGKDYLFRQLAEECCELAHACLKMVRARHGETPMKEDDVMPDLIEEMADVYNQLDAVYMWMTELEKEMIKIIQKEKQRRMEVRLEDYEIENRQR